MTEEILKEQHQVSPDLELATKRPPQESELPPEEGLTGWLSLAGSCLCLFSTFGFLNAIGVFQANYEVTTLRKYSPSDISWIFALQLCLMWLPGPLFGRMLDTYGPRPLLWPCSVLCVFSLSMTSLCHEYYQIILAQGLGFGIGAGGVFTTAVVCSGQWFVRRRGLALGIVTAGRSLGGVIFPFFVNKVQEAVGFPGAIRYTALFIGILLAAACCLVSARLPTKKWDHESKWVDVTLLKDRSFVLYTTGAFFIMWGLWTQFDYLSLMASTTAGFSKSMSLYLISILNAGSLPGRILPSYIADKIGYFNVMTVISLAAGLSMLALWLPFDYHRSHVGLVLFALIYGLVSGGVIGLMMPCVARAGDLKNLGQRFGTFQLVMALSCLTGLPIQGAILAKEGAYLSLQLFAATSMTIGALLVAAARVSKGTSLLVKV